MVLKIGIYHIEKFWSADFPYLEFLFKICNQKGNYWAVDGDKP